jgi:hypothetical protein
MRELLWARRLRSTGRRSLVRPRSSTPRCKRSTPRKEDRRRRPRPILGGRTARLRRQQCESTSVRRGTHPARVCAFDCSPVGRSAPDGPGRSQCPNAFDRCVCSSPPWSPAGLAVLATGCGGGGNGGGASNPSGSAAGSGDRLTLSFSSTITSTTTIAGVTVTTTSEVSASGIPLSPGSSGPLRYAKFEYAFSRGGCTESISRIVARPQEPGQPRRPR